MGCTIQSNFELNNILTGHEVKGASNNFKFSPTLVKKDEMDTLSIPSEKMTTSRVAPGNNFSSLHEPTKVLGSKNNIISPNRIAFSRKGIWAVTDGAKHCVNIFNNQDELIQVIGGTNDRENQFKNPKGVAFDSDNCLYIVDSGNQRIVKFDIDGNYLLQFSTKGSGNRQFSDPSGIAVHDDRVYIADSGNCHVAVFQSDGQFCSTFGSEEFEGILDVSISADNLVLVSNWSNEAVHVFTLGGECVSKFGRRGYYKTPLNYPYCLTTEPNGCYTLIAEYYNHRVSVFDKEGALVHGFGSKGSTLGQFQYIEGVGVSPNGRIYISDNGNHRIQIF